MTVDELIAEHESRREAKRWVWVSSRLTRAERGEVHLERACRCHGCRHAHCYAPFECEGV
jgi:hypothetical protein